MKLQSFFKRTLVVFVVAMLLASVFLLPGNSSADEQTNPSTERTWQTDPSVTRAYNTQTGALNYVSFPPNIRSNYNFTAFNRQDAQSDLAAFNVEFGLGDISKNIKFVKSTKTVSGSTSYRYQQMYKNVPVFAGELIMNYDAAGYLAAISGETVAATLSVNTTPNIDSASATQSAMAYVAKVTGLPMSYLVVSAPELWVYDESFISPYDAPAKLVWKMEVTSIQPSSIRYLVMADANIRGIDLAINQNDYFWGEAAANARIIIEDVPPVPTTSALWVPNHNNTLITYDSNNTSGRQGTGGSTLECTTVQPAAVTLFGAGSCETPVTGSPASDANAAQYWAQSTMNYFDFYFSRDSIDDNGMTVISNVRYTDAPPALYGNAFWDGTQMTYGNDGFWPSDDVVAHELTHGVTENTSNLVYYYEAGAINESLSDVFGEYYDMLNGSNSRTGAADGIAAPADPNNWLMGEDLTIGAIRSMSNPPAFGDPDRMRHANYRLFPTGATWGVSADDQGGVHTNSGVANKAAYLMAVGGTFNGQTITALGSDLENSIELSLQIWYEVEYLLTTGSDYSVLDQALVTACNNLIGGSFPGTAETLTVADCTEVDEVTTATEMHLEPSAAGYRPHTTVACTNPTHIISDIVNFTFESGLETGFTFQTLTGATQFHTVFDWWGWNSSHSLYLEDTVGTDSITRLSSSVALTGGTEYWLYFDHTFGFETGRWDGAVLEYTTNGTTWVDAAPLFNAGLGYNGVGRNNGTVPARIRNIPAFIEDSHGFVSSRYNLATLAGQPTVNFRWRVLTDGSVFDVGWLLDNVRIYRCTPPTDTPTNTPVTPTDTPTNTPVTPTDTPTNTPVTPTDTPTNTPVTPTDTPTNTPVTPTDTPTNTPVTPTDTPTNTPVTPTDTPTNTPVTPTDTPTNTPVTPTDTPTNTPVTPTDTPTNTPVTPTDTPTETPVTPTDTPTNTPVTPTDTPTNTPVTPTDTPTETPVTPTDTPTNTPVTPTDTPTETPVTPTETPVTPTETPVTPTETPVTPTETPVTPTNTPVTPTNTPVTPTNTPVTPTNTPVTPTLTPTGPTATNTATPCVISATPPTLLSPTHRTHTTDTTPTFTWSTVANAQSYRLMVYLEDRSFVYKKRTFNTTYTLSADEALTPDQYLWRVRTQDKTCSTWSKWSKRNTLFVDATSLQVQPAVLDVLKSIFN